MNGTYAGVLFDIDDTLYSVGELMKMQWSAHAPLLADSGLEAQAVCDAFDRIRMHVPYRELLTGVLDFLGHSRDKAQILHSAANNGVPAELELLPGVKGLFESLRNHDIKVGFLSNGNHARQYMKIQALGLEGLYDELLVCDGENLPFKPDPQAFLQACARLGLNPSQVCMVGDRPDNDILPAVKLGMGTIRLRFGNHHEQSTPPGALLHTCHPQTAWAFLLDHVKPQPSTVTYAPSIPAPRVPRESFVRVAV